MAVAIHNIAPTKSAGNTQTNKKIEYDNVWPHFKASTDDNQNRKNQRTTHIFCYVALCYCRCLFEYYWFKNAHCGHIWSLYCFFSCVSSLHSNMMYSISEFVVICRICAYWSTNQPTVSITPHITDAWARAQRKRNVLCGHTQTVTNRREEIIFVFFMSKIVFIHVFVWSVLLLQRSFAVWHAFFITIGLS